MVYWQQRSSIPWEMELQRDWWRRCWRHTAVYLSYWLCVKSHPPSVAGRGVVLVIYSNLSPPCCGWEFLINAVSTGLWLLCQHLIRSARSGTVQLRKGEQLHIRNSRRTKLEATRSVFLLRRCRLDLGQQARRTMLQWLTGEPTLRVVKMSQVWIQFVTSV